MTRGHHDPQHAAFAVARWMAPGSHQPNMERPSRATVEQQGHQVVDAERIQRAQAVLAQNDDGPEREAFALALRLLGIPEVDPRTGRAEP